MRAFRDVDFDMYLDMHLIGLKVAEKLGVLISTHVQRQDSDCPEKKISRHPVQFQTRVLCDWLPLVSPILRGCAVHCVAVQHLQYRANKKSGQKIQHTVLTVSYLL